MCPQCGHNYNRLAISIYDYERTAFVIDKNNTLVKYSLPEDNKTIMASKYQLYLPSEKQLLDKLKRELENIEYQTFNK